MQLDEMQLWLSVEFGVSVSTSTICRYHARNNFTRKKVTRIASERNEELRSIWSHDVHSTLFDYQIVCTDESAVDECLSARQYGYSLRGVECFVSTPFVRGQRFTLTPALTVDGFIALDVVEGSMDAVKFHDFILLCVV